MQLRELMGAVREDVDSVFARDPAARSVWEVVTTYPGFHARCLHRIAHFLWLRGWRWPARFVAFFARWLTGIEIHPGARIGKRLFIDHGMGVVIGETAEIGDDCTLYHGVTLGGTSGAGGKRHPTLGDRIVVGAGAKILGPIAIGDGARIGSNSVVLKSVPPDATVVGIPAHIVSPDRQARAQQRESIARKLRFDAYGMAADMPDPVAHAINQMLIHIQCLQRQIAAMKAVMQEQGLRVEDVNTPDLAECQLLDGDEAISDTPAYDEAPRA